jgi:FkbM family methyltransferase
VIEPETYDTLYGNVYDIRKNQYTILGDDSEMYSLIAGNTIYEISKRKQPGDFLLLFGGFWHKRIADAHQDMIVVEPAIGYPASFCNYKVYPSYAFMHRFVVDSNLQMNSYHVVIPHYFDVDDFDATQPKEDYFLFVGRLNFDKGITLAIDLAAKIGVRLKVCGQGNLLSLGYDKIPDHVDFIGYVGVEQRKQLMSKAKCLIMPTLYMEPFGCVAIEGMLSGTPILTNDWGGPGENNIHGVTGFKCRTYEQFEWAARNIHLIDPKKCREWAEKNFSFDKIGHMYEDYFQSLQGIDWYKPNPSRTNLDHLTKHYPNTVTRKIPYNLFQTFKTKDISPALQAFIDTWKEKNPEYTYNFYDDDMCDKFMKEFDARTWKAYCRIIPGAFKADLWRYCVLYKYGGVYADVDTVCLGKIDDFLNEKTEFVTPIDLDDKLLYNAFIAAAPGSKILKHCIDTIVHNVENNIVPEDKIYFSACGVLANCTNDFLGRDKQSSFAGHVGWHDTTHLLKFEPVNQHVKDEKGTVLFQNKEKHNELHCAYTTECAGLNLTPWFYCKDILRKDTDWALNLHLNENKVYSQFGQDGIIQEIFRNIGTTNKYCVEFGQNRPNFEESNTGFLRLEQNWDGLVMDLDTKHPSIKNEMITSKNIVSLFHKYNVPLEADFVSIDIDSCDLWVFKSIIQSEFKPRVISVEYNCTYADMSTIPDDPEFRWRGDCVYGASLYALEYTGRMNGYTLVAAVYPVDCFFIRNDILDDIPVCPLEFYSSKVNPNFNRDAPPERKAIMFQVDTQDCPSIDTPNGLFEIDPDDLYILKHMTNGNVYESHIINGQLKPYIEKSKYIVDVGANIGCHAISYANMNPTCNVWAFEPQNKLFGILSRNITRNNLNDRVELFKYGLGHKETSTTLYSLDKVWDAGQGGYNKAGLGIGQGGESINICTLDSLNLPGLDFMKIDVEGAEGLVLQGAAETIKKYKPVIFFEHNEQRIDPKVLGLEHVPTPFEVLATLGYKNFKYVDWANYITEG